MTKKKEMIVGLSGGPDSVFLLLEMQSKGGDLVAAHLNHSTRGKESDADQRFVERLGKMLGVRVVSGKVPGGSQRLNRPEVGTRGSNNLSESRMRKSRYGFLGSVRKDVGAGGILVAHTADDQVETVLMRILEGAGIAGLKGIPRKTKDGIERPILDVWREDILKYLKNNRIPYRVDKSNFDTRIERNWIRHVLIPLLEDRYGKSVKKRLFALGERFREIDRFLETSARKWVGRNIRAETGGAMFIVRRKTFGKLPSELRIRILQILCFEKAHISPNERLLTSMDRLISSGSVSKRLAVGKGATLSCSYEDARLTPTREIAKRQTEKPVRMTGPGQYEYSHVCIRWEEKTGGLRASAIRKGSAGERVALFDADGLRLPLTVRFLRYGDRIRPFGMDSEKKVKEILIDRKIPRDVRWGRPVVCDAKGTILWIPGVIRSAHAPVTPRTLRSIRLGISDRSA